MHELDLSQRTATQRSLRFWKLTGERGACCTLRPPAQERVEISTCGALDGPWRRKCVWPHVRNASTNAIAIHLRLGRRLLAAAADFVGRDDAAVDEPPLGCRLVVRRVSQDKDDKIPFHNTLILLVPLAGLEPARPCGQQILSLIGQHSARCPTIPKSQ